MDKQLLNITNIPIEKPNIKLLDDPGREGVKPWSDYNNKIVEDRREYFPFDWLDVLKDDKDAHFKEMNSFIDYCQTGKIWERILWSVKMWEFLNFLNQDTDRVMSEKVFWVSQLVNSAKEYDIGNIFVKTKAEEIYRGREYTFIGSIDDLIKDPSKNPKEKIEEFHCAKKIEFDFYRSIKVDKTSITGTYQQPLRQYYIMTKPKDYTADAECDQRVHSSIKLTLENVVKKLVKGGKSYVGLELTDFNTWEGVNDVTPVVETNWAKNVLVTFKKSNPRYYIINYVIYADISVEGTFPNPKDPNNFQCIKAKFGKTPIAFSLLKFECKNNKLLSPKKSEFRFHKIRPNIIFPNGLPDNMPDFEIVGSSDTAHEEIETSNFIEVKDSDNNKMATNQGHGKDDTPGGTNKDGSWCQCCTIL